MSGESTVVSFSDVFIEVYYIIFRYSPLLAGSGASSGIGGGADAGSSVGGSSAGGSFPTLSVVVPIPSVCPDSSGVGDIGSGSGGVVVAVSGGGVAPVTSDDEVGVGSPACAELSDEAGR